MAAGIFDTLLALAASMAAGMLFGIALMFTDEGVEADAKSFGAGERKVGRRPSVMNKRTQQLTDPFALGTVGL